MAEGKKGWITDVRQRGVTVRLYSVGKGRTQRSCREKKRKKSPRGRSEKKVADL